MATVTFLGSCLAMGLAPTSELVVTTTAPSDMLGVQKAKFVVEMLERLDDPINMP